VIRKRKILKEFYIEILHIITKFRTLSSKVLIKLCYYECSSKKYLKLQADYSRF